MHDSSTETLVTRARAPIISYEGHQLLAETVGPGLSCQGRCHYHFYETAERNANGEVGNLGDRHYKCLHRNAKVLTITKKMKYSLNGECRTCSSTQCVLTTSSRSDRSFEGRVGTNVSPLYGDEGVVT